MSEKICNCRIPKNISFEEMQKTIEDYISSIDEEECVSDKIYEQRLEKCNNCDGLYGGATCRYCGCFVLVRAKKKKMYCPYPADKKWDKAVD